METRFLTRDDVLALHARQIELYGGEPAIRDERLLLSALAMPESSFGGEYLHAGIAEMAAAYLFHIVMNHPFVDGNKRTGTDAAVTFIFFNNHDLNATPGELTEFVWKLAAGEVDKDAVTRFFQERVVPL